MNINRPALKEIIEHIAPNLGIFMGNKAYLFASLTSIGEGIARRKVAEFSPFGSTLISFKWSQTTSEMVVKITMKNANGLYKERVTFDLGNDSSDYLNCIDKMKTEILIWITKMKFFIFSPIGDSL